MACGMEWNGNETRADEPRPVRGNGPAPSAAPLATPAVIGSDMLLAGRREILIRHGTELYRLRLTANNKLILTK